MTTPDFETFSDLLRRRHSCRAFLPAEVPRETIERIIATAGLVPSWCNAQPWSVVVTSGGETDRFRDMLMNAAAQGDPEPDFAWPTGYSGRHQEARRASGWQLYDAVGVKKGDREGSARQHLENFRLFGAPHVAIVTSPKELGTYGAVDCGAFVVAFTLAAEALGVASVPQAAVAAFASPIRAHLGLPDDQLVVCGISFGYRDEDHPANSYRTSRAETREILTFRG